MTTTLDLDFTLATTTLDPRITFSRASLGTYFDSAGVLRTAAINAPRFDYDPVTHAAKGLLIERSTINNINNYSQDFSSGSYTKTGLTVTADQLAAPDGTTTADLITASANPATISTSQTSFPAYANSVFAKKGSTDWIYMVGIPGDTPKAWFNLNTGATGTVQAGLTGAGIQNCGNGWYRCWISDEGGGTATIVIGISNADNSTTVTAGKTVYLWGLQGESSVTAPTSYIPTFGSQVGRSEDIALMTGTNFSSWFNQSAGTIVVDFDLVAITTGSIQGMLTVDDTTTNNYVRFIRFSADQVTQMRRTGSDQAFFTFAPMAINTLYKNGLSYALNDVAGCINGGTVQTDTTATPPTLTRLYIGADSTGPNYMNGHIRHIQFQNTALTDAELITLTTPGPWSGGEPVPPAIGPTTTGGSAFWDQDYDDREYESSRKRRKRFLDERARRIAELD